MDQGPHLGRIEGSDSTTIAHSTRFRPVAGKVHHYVNRVANGADSGGRVSLSFRSYGGGRERNGRCSSQDGGRDERHLKML